MWQIAKQILIAVAEVVIVAALAAIKENRKNK